MPRIGGEAARFGFRYESLWTVDAALDVIDGEYDDLTVEQIGDEAAGVEFILTKAPRVREYHSIKRQQTDGNWTISRLARGRSSGRSILGDLIAKIHTGDTCVFTSGTSASRLEELICRAQASQSFQEFRHRLDASDELLTLFLSDFAQLCDSELAAYAALKHLRVRVKNEPVLIRDVELRIRAKFRRESWEPTDAQVVRLLIADLVDRRLGQRLTPTSILRYLAEHGYVLAQRAGDGSVGQRINDINHAHVTDVNVHLINGHDILRHEADTSVEALVELDQHVLLEGTAGRGKSCVVAQVLKKLAEKEVPCLIFSLDWFPEGRPSAQAVGTSLGLPDSPTLTLGEFAGGQPCVLLFDQLDALSVVSARQRMVRGPFNEMLIEADRYPNMRILLACRTFDFEQDPEILGGLAKRQKHVKRIPIGTLDDTIVREAIRASHIARVPLRADQLQILATPLHLYLFLKASGDGQVDFTKSGDLFDAFWQYKARAIDQRLGQPGAWISGITALCEALSDREALVAPKYALDSHSIALDVMASEGVVQIRDDRVQFFHESFFDYAFARTFLQSNKEIVAWLVSDPQHLFRRSQVRQVLAFLRSRETDWIRYLRTLEGLLRDKGIRFHIKKLTLDLLRDLPDPTADEWRILEGLTQELEGHVWRVVSNRVPWFDLLQEMGCWATWLSADDAETEHAVALLRMPDVLDSRSAVVAAIVDPFRGVSDKWQELLRWLATSGHGYASHEMQDLVICLIADGTLDDARRGSTTSDDWWLVWYSTAKERPRFFARVLGTWFDRQVARALEGEGNSPFRGGRDFVLYSQFSSEVITDCASRAPREFVSELLPRFASFDRQFPRDWISAPSSFDSPDEQLRDALAEAMGSLARNEPAELDATISASYLTKTTWMSALVLGALSANPAVYADRIVRFLLRSPDQRLSIEYGISNPSADTLAAISRRAVAAASSHCSDALFGELLAAILHFTPEWERMAKKVGRTELSLLRALPEERLSDIARGRIRELECQYPLAPEQGVPEPPSEPYLVSTLGPPLPEKAQRRLTDNQWLSAMERYSTGWDSVPHETAEGGAIELSRGLQTLVQEDPERFSRLADRMDASLHPAYFEALLQGLTRSDDNGRRPGTLLQVCAVLRRVERIGASVSGVEFAFAIGALADEPVPDDILRLLCTIAETHADPESDTWQDRNPPTDPIDQAINSARGAAALALSKLLFADRNRWSKLRQTVKQLAGDPVLAVRSVAVRCLLAVLDSNREDALDLFGSLADGASAVFGTSNVEQFVHFAMFRNYAAVQPVVRQMLESCQSAAVVAAARQIAIAALSIEEANEDLEELLQLGEEVRTGVAEVCAANLADESLAAECEGRLRTFFRDDSTTVRKAANRCWSRLEPDQIAARRHLIGAFAHALKPGDDLLHLVHGLQEARFPLPGEVCDLAERAVATFGSRAASIQFREGGDANGAVAANGSTL